MRRKVWQWWDTVLFDFRQSLWECRLLMSLFQYLPSVLVTITKSWIMLDRTIVNYQCGRCWSVIFQKLGLPKLACNWIFFYFTVWQLKDLKRQLHAERKRAEKLQERLQEVLSDTKNKSMKILRSFHSFVNSMTYLCLFVSVFTFIHLFVKMDGPTHACCLFVHSLYSLNMKMFFWVPVLINFWNCQRSCKFCSYAHFGVLLCCTSVTDKVFHCAGMEELFRPADLGDPLHCDARWVASETETRACSG